MSIFDVMMLLLNSPNFTTVFPTKERETVSLFSRVEERTHTERERERETVERKLNVRVISFVLTRKKFVARGLTRARRESVSDIFAFFLSYLGFL
jgi:hypothetical protein